MAHQNKTQIDFVTNLINDAGVAAVPGRGFFHRNCDGESYHHQYVRFAFCKSDDTLTAFGRLELEAGAGVVWEKNTVTWLVARGWSWSGVRGNYCRAGALPTSRTRLLMAAALRMRKLAGTKGKTWLIGSGRQEDHTVSASPWCGSAWMCVLVRFCLNRFILFVVSG